jgi:glycosyltransferase involved in cell wall biosynthesis
MRILHVIASMDPKYGGPAQGIRNLDLGKNDNQIVREVVCFDDTHSPYLEFDTFKVHALGKGKGVWNYSQYLIPWLNKNIENFDVVIINGLWQYYSYATWKVMADIKRKSPNKKMPRFLVMPHGMLDPYFQRASNRKVKALRNWLYWKAIERNVINDCDGLLFTCQTELLLARETFKPYKPKKEYDVGYGIDAPPKYHDGMSVAFNKLCPDLNGAPYLLFLSRIHTKKGLNLLIDAYLNLYESNSNNEADIPKLVIAGPGLDTNYGQSLQNKVSAKSKAKQNIFFTGMLTNDSKWGAFYGCEAFVLPSHQENFGIAVVEALACGKPVLISNQVNIWREIINEGAGLVENDDKQGAQNLLKKWLMISQGEKIQMGINALATFHKYFAISKIAQNYTDAFMDGAVLEPLAI